ncbi:hypothetical protein EUX98_g4926 [Antrodiella citrinella]|uniref:NAD(+) diphosphatase n=1 Tax=Antrodiella citrinella TaxID=2447956 RepID=A0A4S4MSU9_9APHY|nr:hypothetical protein EUX98_g4926 [Antrodiella citrinella]
MAAGDKLVDVGVRLGAVYAGTEFGGPSPVLDGRQAPEDWEYVTFSPNAKPRLVEQDRATSSLMIGQTCKTHKLSIENLPDVKVYNTSDLFTPHPTKRGLWKIVGRTDDVIILNTAEKVVPIPQEDYLHTTLMVSGAVMFGRGRNQHEIIIEPRDEFAIDPKDTVALAALRNNVWIFKELIIVTDPSKRFPRASKGPIQKKTALKLYAEEIDDLQHLAFSERKLPKSLLTNGKLVALTADHGRSDLGLGPDVLGEMKRSTTHVIHNAWNLDFNLSISSFESNIAYTRTLLDICATCQNAVRLLFTSSVGSVGNWDVAKGKVPEEMLQNINFDGVSGYSASKAIVQVLSLASEKGLAATSLRIGQISGASKSGSWAVSDWVPIIVISSVKLKCLPALDGDVAWMLVDTVCHTITDMMLSEGSPEVVNVVHPHPVPWNEMFEGINEALSERLPIIPFHGWLSKVEALSTNATAIILNEVCGMADSSLNSTNFFSGSPLNRLSWLRTSQVFLNSVALSPSARWVLFKDGQPLVASEPSAEPDKRGRKSLGRLTTAEVRSLLGSDPFFAQGQNDGEVAPAGVSVLEADRLRGPPIVFLGLHEPNSEGGADALPSSDFSAKIDAAAVAEKIKGTPYFTLDVSAVEQKHLDEVIHSAEARQHGTKLGFTDARGALYAFTSFDAAVTAEGKSMVDWNARNKFCPSCTSPIYSVWAGWKLSCSSLLPWADNAGRKPCPTATGLNNFSHPRTDAVVIMAVLNEANDKVLLGRNRKWANSFYSALAGFIEPGESLEDAVKRELWEEAGLKVWGIRYHSTQPWPFPANLMVGFYAIADPSLPTRVDLDNELEDAKLFTREEILAVLDHPDGTNMGPRETKPQDSPKAGAEALAEPPFRLPPTTAIAGVLISDWARGKTTQIKGNL